MHILHIDKLGPLNSYHCKITELTSAGAGGSLHHPTHTTLHNFQSLSESQRYNDYVQLD